MTVSRHHALQFWIYQAATYATFNLLDDAAILAFVFS